MYNNNGSALQGYSSSMEIEKSDHTLERGKLGSIGHRRYLRSTISVEHSTGSTNEHRGIGRVKTGNINNRRFTRLGEIGNTLEMCRGWWKGKLSVGEWYLISKMKSATTHKGSAKISRN